MNLLQKYPWLSTISDCIIALILVLLFLFGGLFGTITWLPILSGVGTATMFYIAIAGDLALLVAVAICIIVTREN